MSDSTPQANSPGGRRFSLATLLLILVWSGILLAWFAPRLVTEPPQIAWEPYSDRTLKKHLILEQPVLINFTADWSIPAIQNETLFESAAVRRLLRERGVVCLRADWTDGSPEIQDVLNRLQSRSIPLIAIISAREPNKVYILRDVVSEEQLLTAIREATD